MQPLRNDTVWICSTCGVEHVDDEGVCPVCADERQWVPASGQRWTTLAQLAGGRLPDAAARARAWSARAHGRAQDRDRAERVRDQHPRRDGGVGPARVRRRRGRRARPRARRAARHQLQPPTHVRRATRVEPAARRCARARVRAKPRVGLAHRPGGQRARRPPRNRARGDAASVRRPLLREHGAALGRRCRQPGRAAVVGHDPRQPRPGDGHVHAQLSEPDPAVGGGRRADRQRGRAASSSIGCTTTSRTRSIPTRAPRSGVLPTATSPGCEATSTT